MTVRWGFLGAGWIVQTATARALRDAPSATLAAVAARDIERARSLEPESTYGSYAELIDDDSIDAVYIALANDQHAPWIHAAIDAGKHVLCEKPLTMSTQDSARAFEAAEAAGVLLVEAAWSMWHPRMQRLVDVVRSGDIGSLRNFLGTFTFDGVPDGNYRLDPSMGGGALFDIGIYPLHALMAAHPDFAAVNMDVERELGGLGVDMTTKATLTTGDEFTASVVASFAMPESQRLVFDGADGRVLLPGNQAFTSLREATELMLDDHVEEFAPTDAYSDMFEAVSARILGQDAWILPAESSLRVAALVDALR